MTVPLSVSLLPQNEMAPLFPNNPTLTVPEDYSPGALLYTYTAADSDAAPHGVQEYQLISGMNCVLDKQRFKKKNNMHDAKFNCDAQNVKVKCLLTNSASVKENHDFFVNKVTILYSLLHYAHTLRFELNEDIRTCS